MTRAARPAVLSRPVPPRPDPVRPPVPWTRGEARAGLGVLGPSSRTGLGLLRCSVTLHTTIMIGVCAGQMVRDSGPDQRDYMGRAPHCRFLAGLYYGSGCSQLRVGPSGLGRTNSLRHQDYCPADPRGIFLPAHFWDGSPGKVIRHSTRRARRALPHLGGGSVSRRTRSGWRRRTKRRNGT